MPALFSKHCPLQLFQWFSLTQRLAYPCVIAQKFALASNIPAVKTIKLMELCMSMQAIITPACYSCWGFSRSNGDGVSVGKKYQLALRKTSIL